MNTYDSKRAKYCPEERGSTATEYVMLVGFIAFAVIAAVTLFGTALNSYYISLANAIASALGAA